MAKCACSPDCPKQTSAGRHFYYGHKRSPVRRRLCACGCGASFMPVQAATRFIRGHNNHARRKPRRVCQVCGNPVGSRNQRAKYCHSCYLTAVAPGLIRTWMKENPERHRAAAMAAARKGLPAWTVPSAPVSRVLKQRGVTPRKLAAAFSISEPYARHLIAGRHPRMAKEMAERILRYAAGMPYKPTAQQSKLAQRREWLERRARERAGTGSRPETRFEQRFHGLS